jgi:hypothetical protein
VTNEGPDFQGGLKQAVTTREITTIIMDAFTCARNLSEFSQHSEHCHAPQFPDKGIEAPTLILGFINQHV